ncbi:uncharacterized protein LOC116027927 [Ipomoea triloba]|uniref:uncharacterized protein LOC116027927 n=1 Tax=Ipomoea triloba TaxID=35885 RepID=UPI00125DF477|nr:uncharacterized protein LOC116027927 [Ipomoea triloba]
MQVRKQKGKQSVLFLQITSDPTSISYSKFSLMPLSNCRPSSQCTQVLFRQLQPIVVVYRSFQWLIRCKFNKMQDSLSADRLEWMVIFLKSKGPCASSLIRIWVASYKLDSLTNPSKQKWQ